MLRSIFKVKRLILPKAARSWSIHEPCVHYSIFNLFRKKKEDNLPQEAKPQEGEVAEVDEAAEKLKKMEEDTFVDRKQYFEKLKKEREEFEAEKEKMKKEYEFEEQRDKREFQVNVAQVDYARILQENINIRVTDSFKHLEELYYFISNLKVRLSEDNIRKCLEGFLYLAERVNSKDLEKPQFKEFIEILKANVMVLASNETLLLLLRFADLYIVDDVNLWQMLERKVLQKFQQFNKEELVGCIIHFANQNEGTDMLYDQFEKVIIPHLHNLKIDQLVAVAQSYYQVKKGSDEFFGLMHNEIMQNINDSSHSDLIRLSIVYSAMNFREKFKTFEKIENLVKEKLDEFNLPEICLVAEAFGMENGSEEFFKSLENRIIDKLPELEFEQIFYVLRGFLYTYRGSKQLFNAMKSRLEMFFPRMDLKTLSTIAKAYHISENDDKQFESLLERYVVVSLKKLDQLTVEDIFEVASSYNVTRIGSRELYKVLEFVIRDKMGEIAKSPEIARGLYYLYTTSGLCSPELLKKLQFIV